MPVIDGYINIVHCTLCFVQYLVIYCVPWNVQNSAFNEKYLNLFFISV